MQIGMTKTKKNTRRCDVQNRPTLRREVNKRIKILEQKVEDETKYKAEKEELKKTPQEARCKEGTLKAEHRS